MLCGGGVVNTETQMQIVERANPERLSRATSFVSFEPRRSFRAPRHSVWNAAFSFGGGERVDGQMREFGHTQVGDGNEVACSTESPGGTLGWL